MRVLAEGSHGDIPVVGGESGVAALAAVQVIAGHDVWRQQASLTADSRVLVINTERATAPGVEERLFG